MKHFQADVCSNIAKVSLLRIQNNKNTFLQQKKNLRFHNSVKGFRKALRYYSQNWGEKLINQMLILFPHTV